LPGQQALVTKYYQFIIIIIIIIIIEYDVNIWLPEAAVPTRLLHCQVVNSELDDKLLRLVTDRVNTGGNAIASVHPHVCLSVRPFPLIFRTD